MHKSHTACDCAHVTVHMLLLHEGVLGFKVSDTAKHLTAGSDRSSVLDGIGHSRVHGSVRSSFPEMNLRSQKRTAGLPLPTSHASMPMPATLDPEP